MDLLEDKFDDESGERVDKAEEHINSLAKQVIKKPVLLNEELSWLVTEEAKNGYRFAYKLGQIDKDFILLPILLNAQKIASEDKKASDYFIGGYLKALNERDNKRWELLMDDLSEDDKLASWIAGFTWRSGVSDNAALRIFKS